MKYSVIIYTHNAIGLLSQISNIFTRRDLDIWSMLALPTDIKGVHTITIVVDNAGKREKSVHDAAMHCEKRVDVLKAYYYEGDLINDKSPQIYEHLESKVRAFMTQRDAEKESLTI